MHLIVASTSSIYGVPYLSYLQTPVASLFKGRKKILFIPFARSGGISCDAYTQKAAGVFNEWGFEMRGAHQFENATAALDWSEGVFTGGGNTFLLLKTIYDENWFQPLQTAVAQGLPYMGTSAGANLCGISVGTTNDMPIVHPPSLQAMGWLPFNINPHYLDPVAGSTHMGETREDRIAEFHCFNTQPVIGLREGSYLQVNGNDIWLKGPHSARLFRAAMPAVELEPGPLVI